VSNYARVILAWSGIDKAVELAGTGARVQTIIDRYNEEMGRSILLDIQESCVRGFACEVTAVLDINHFAPEEMLKILRGLAWEIPEEVAIIYKDEHMDSYAIISILRDMDAPDAE
jgi:hypothetical protein